MYTLYAFYNVLFYNEVRNRFWLLAAVVFFYSVQVQNIDQSEEDRRKLINLPMDNISQEEYRNILEMYLENFNDYESNGLSYALKSIQGEVLIRGKGIYPFIQFPNELPIGFDIKQAELRVLLSSFTDPTPVNVFQVSSNVAWFQDGKVIHFSGQFPKWDDFDVTVGVKNAINESIPLTLEVECDHCIIHHFKLLQAFLNIIVFTNPHINEASLDELCGVKPMEVVFSDLRVPNVQSRAIKFPRSYQAGICQGKCFPKTEGKVNYDTLQRLVFNNSTKDIMRPTCCAPIEFKPLTILRVDPNVPTKLHEEVWEKMSVVRCACT